MASLADLSIIIPLGPGEASWRGLLADLTLLPSAAEIILVACSGTAPPADWATIAASVSARVQWIDSVPGRAQQQNAGAAVACGKVLWFLHADSRLAASVWSKMPAVLGELPGKLGYFDLGFADDGPLLMRLNAIGANLRSRGFGLPFGDQGLFLATADFLALGGFDPAVGCGEDHDLVWRARHAGLRLRRVPATIRTSARKYFEHGWWATTFRHLLATWQQRRRFSVASAVPQHRGGLGAVAIFVKTPGYSALKTRLAASIGGDAATRWYQTAAAAVLEVAERAAAGQEPKCCGGHGGPGAAAGQEPKCCGGHGGPGAAAGQEPKCCGGHGGPGAAANAGPAVYWAIAETAALGDPAWSGAAGITQGEGELGTRMARVHRQLVERHGYAILIGADAPQLCADDLLSAARWLQASTPRAVIGPAADGGFWLFGSNRVLATANWEAVAYSQADSARQFMAQMHGCGDWLELRRLGDVDTWADFQQCHHALRQLTAPTPAQIRLNTMMDRIAAVPSVDLGAPGRTVTGHRSANKTS